MQVQVRTDESVVVLISEVRKELRIYVDRYLYTTIGQNESKELRFPPTTLSSRLDFELKSEGDFKCLVAVKAGSGDLQRTLYTACPENWEDGDPAWQDTLMIVRM